MLFMFWFLFEKILFLQVTSKLYLITFIKLLVQIEYTNDYYILDIIIKICELLRK